MQKEHLKTGWLFAGLTGLLLVVVVCIMLVFALPVMRKHAYRYFWITHRCGYVAFYILCILHGLPRLTGVRCTA